MERLPNKRNMKVVRIELPGTKGTRPVRPNDGVLDGHHNRSIGWVLSCAFAGDKQIALVYVNAEAVEEGNDVGISYVARNPRQIQQGRKEHIEKGELWEPDLTGKVVGRFAKF